MKAPSILVLSLAFFAAGCTVNPPPREPVADVTPPASFETAVTLYDRGELADAETILLGLRDSQPERVEVAFYLGRVYFEQKRYGEAVTQLEAAAALDDSDVDVLLWLGQALGKHVHEVVFFRKLPMAKQIHQVFLRAIELEPDRVEGQTALARFYSEAPRSAGGDREKSLEHAAELIRLDPVAGHRLLSSIYVRFEEIELARQELRSAIEALEASGGRENRRREDAEKTLAELRERLHELETHPDPQPEFDG